MSDPASFLVLISDATHRSFDVWLSWLVIGSAGPLLFINWADYRKRKISLRHALLIYGVWGFVITVNVFDLLRK